MLISIHALREEGDVEHLEGHCELIQFLSTPSARRATRRVIGGNVNDDISIHALREEGDNSALM